MNMSRPLYFIFNMFSGRLLLAGLFLLLNGVVQAAHAAPGNLFVTTTGSGSACAQATPCDLQTALNNALDGDTVYVAGGTYTSTFPAVINLVKNITLYGGWNGKTTGLPVRDPEAYVTTIDGEDARRGIHISGNITPVVDGLHITRGNAAGLGGYEYPAGAIYDAGGGVYVSVADVTLTNISISGSSAEFGGGVFLNNSPGTVAHSTISGNTATSDGGGVFAYKGNPTLSNNSITSNTSSFQGGGLYLFDTTASLQNNMITANEAVQYGGGVSVASCNPVFTGNIIARNKAKNSAGIHLWYSRSGTFVNNVIVDNQLIVASGRGSAIGMYGSSRELKHTTFARNSGGDGSAILISTAGSSNSFVSMKNSIIVGHTVGVHVDTGSKLTHDGTLWGTGSWANTTDWDGAGTITPGPVNIWGNPDFIDPDNGNYRINADSAAIDAGVDAGVTEDMDGDERPQNRGYDIGADEYDGVIAGFPWNMFLPAITKNGQL